MKILRIVKIVFAASLFFAPSIFSPLCIAQQLDGRVQTQPVIAAPAAPSPVQTPEMAMLYTKRSMKPDGKMTTASVPFEISGSDTNQLDVSDGAEHTVQLWIRNTSSTPLYIYFDRTQLLPIGWVTSVCWFQTCYADAIDSEVLQQDDTISPLPPGDSASISLNVTAALSDYSDSSVTRLRIGILGSPADSILLVFHGGFKPGNPPIVFQWSQGTKFQFVFSGTGNHSISDILENHAGLQTEYHFALQDSLPQGWSISKFCSANNCSTGLIDSSSFVGFSAVPTYAQAINFTLKVPVLIKKDSAILYLGIHPQTENPADSANYRFVAVVNTHLLENNSAFEFTSGSPNTITAPFKNLLTIPETYHFSLRTVLPDGWSLQNYCAGDSCTTGSDVMGLFDATGGTNAIQNIAFTFQTRAIPTADSGILYLSSYPIDNPGDLRIDTLIAVANPASGVAANTEEATAGLAVTNVWPNPIHSSEKLSLDILTDRSGPCIARMYDITGIEQATVDMGTLHVGANEVQIASPNLHSGEYIIRIEQGNESSEVIRINYIK